MSKNKDKKLSEENLKIILSMQQSELTESVIYKEIAKFTKGENQKTLERLSEEEFAHYNIWKSYTDKEMKPQKLKVMWYKFLAKTLGFTFAVKLMENGEEVSQETYSKLVDEVPESINIREMEEEHETALLDMLDEERLQYVGSMVLGLNDALVELTGTLAGLSFALQNTKLIALSGLITGISATLSMASSEFLAAKSEGRSDAFKSCTYTGIAYLLTVVFLIAPYLILGNAQFMLALAIMLITVVLIIAGFNFYLAVAQGEPFKKRFLEMATISLGVAILSFVIGIFVKQFLGIDI